MDHEFPTGWPEGSDFPGSSCWMEGRNPQNRVDFKTEPEGNLMCSPQALPPMAVNKGQGKAPLCKVCGDESSGFHYGVDSCEGCKGFFRRCITQGMTHKCANEEKCEITPFTRNSCQYCRLKKCFAVGMSREASRLGRRPKRLKESGGDSSKSHSSNLPIAPYPSQAELYRMRMAELQKLLQANGTFKSELMQAFLSAAQASFREHAKHSNAAPGQQHPQVPGNQGAYMDPMATNGNQNMPMDFLGQSQGQFGQGMHPAESGYSSLSSPPDSKMQAGLLDPQAALQDMPASFLDGSDALYGNLPGNLNGSGSSLASPTSTTNFGSSGLYTPDPFNQVKVKTEPGLDNSGGQCSFASSSITSSAASCSSAVASTSTGASPAASSSTPSPSTSSTPSSRLGPMTPQQRTVTPDSSQPECNIDARKILEEVKMPMSDTRRQLIDQVTTAVVEAHLTTCINTYKCIDKLQDERYDADVALADKTTEEKAVIMWQLFLSSMCPEITMVVTFCKRLPGFSDIDQEDQIRLIKQGSFEVMLARYCMLVNAVTETMMDPTHKYRFNRDVVLAMPMGTFFRQFYNIASCFNPLKLMDGEIGLFTAVLIVCPERENLKNKRAISKIQFLFMQALYFLIKKNHPDHDEHFMGLLNTIKVFRNINNEHFKALNDIKMTRPNNYTQFHALHHEVFDGKV